MMRREVKWVAWGLCGVFALYLAGPLWAGWSLRQAVRNRDTAALSARVDWPTLRANIKPRIAKSLQDSAGQSGIFGSLMKRVLGGSVSNAAVEAFITPANISRLLAGRYFVLDKVPGMKPPTDDPDPEDADDPMPPRRLRWAFFESPTRFRVETVNPRLPDSRVVSILELQGLGWKLVDVDIIKK